MLKRELYLKRIRAFYDSEDLIKILVGIRRCGKSIILEQIIEELKNKGIDDEHIIYVNFEMLEYLELRDYKKLNQYVKNFVKDANLYYVFLDEIQHVKDFELVVNSLRASKKYSIFITGSNSRLLSQELSTDLSGRYVKFNIYPLTFKEMLELKQIKKLSRNDFNDYLKWGGLPNRFRYDDDISIQDYLYGVFDSIILRDVVERLKIRDTELFNLILQYVVDTVGREFSADNIVQYLKTMGRDVSTLTIYSYLDALCKALLIQKVYRFEVHGKAIFKTLNKYYITDLGIASIKRNDKNVNLSYALENVVYNELLIRGYQVYIGKTKKGEIDFVAIKNGERKYIQVSYSLSDEETRQREFGAFDVVNDNYPKYVFSLDQENFSQNGIIHKNIIDFLVDEEF